MGALLAQAGAIEDEDTVGALHGSQPVGDDQRRAVGHRRLEGLLHEALALRVQAARGLVENQDLGRLEEDPGNGDPLSLPTGQANAALSHDRVVAGAEAIDELVRVGGAGRRADLRLRGLGPAERDVLGHGPGEQQRLLRHDADRRPELDEGQAAEIGSAQRDVSLGRVPEAGDERRHRRLARAAGSDEGHDLSGTDMRAHAVQSPRIFGFVSEPDIVERQAARCAGRGQREGMARLPDRRLRVEQLEHPPRGAQRLLIPAPERRERRDRRGDGHGVQKERDELAAGDLAGDQQPSALPQDDRDAAEGHEREDPEEHPAKQRPGDRRSKRRANPGREPALLPALAHEGLDDRDLRERLLRHRVGPGDLVLYRRAPRSQHSTETERAQDDDRRDHERREHQARVKERQECECAEQGTGSDAAAPRSDGSAPSEEWSSRTRGGWSTPRSCDP